MKDTMMKKTRKPIPFYLVALLVIFLAFLAWSARQAITDGARITDRDYYSKGLRYNTSEVERRAAASLGWRITPQLAAHTLSLTVSDREQRPVVNADVELTLMLTGHQQTIPLEEQAAGRYRVVLPEQLRGEIHALYVVQLEGTRLERNLLINLQD